MLTLVADVRGAAPVALPTALGLLVVETAAGGMKVSARIARDTGRLVLVAPLARLTALRLVLNPTAAAAAPAAAAAEEE